MFLGYSLYHKDYRCLHPSSGRVYISRHVIFDESSFPNNSLINSSPYVSSTNSLSFESVSSLPPLSSSTEIDTASSSSTTVSPTSPVVNDHVMTTRDKHGIYKPKAMVATKHLLPTALLTNIVAPFPTCFSKDNLIP